MSTDKNAAWGDFDNDHGKTLQEQTGLEAKSHAIIQEFERRRLETDLVKDRLFEHKLGWDEEWQAIHNDLNYENRALLTAIEKLIEEKEPSDSSFGISNKTKEQGEIEKLQQEVMELIQEKRELKKEKEHLQDRLESKQELYNKGSIDVPQPYEMRKFSHAVASASFFILLAGIWATFRGVLDPIVMSIGAIILIFISVVSFTFSRNINDDEYPH